MPYSLVRLLSIILRRKNPRPGKPAENAEIVYHQQLIDNGHSGHLLRAHLAHHDIVKKPHKIGDPILNHNGDRHRQNHFVKSSVPDKFLFQFSLHMSSSLGRRPPEAPSAPKAPSATSLLYNPSSKKTGLEQNSDYYTPCRGKCKKKIHICRI